MIKRGGVTERGGDTASLAGGKRVLRKSLRGLSRIALTYLAFLGFIACAGYYVLIFDWHISATATALHIALMIVAIAALIGIYGIAEKLRSA
ncbi:hypothetical protein ETA_06190 [Erwinia tasmaniensis Et1/99]|uniref:Uncharacterized protein n=1 Tax=Erwinia tasmaniensis (strain DSM 17950 / CFBP 7177 / CIP 109463 / NCPPB 4357 / Et1/99) TaxID=465817 RepID=B2VH81_ERWT9|nr:hypothetical protein ETA_06190 [Erwinia tasmaniensis Et1/99]